MKKVISIFALVLCCLRTVVFAQNHFSSVLVEHAVGNNGSKSTSVLTTELLVATETDYKIRDTKEYKPENGKDTLSIEEKWEQRLGGFLPDGQRFKADQIKSTCDWFKGTIEDIVVPAGKFTTCRIVDSYDSGGISWLGPVPFETVKRTLKNHWIDSVKELQSYSE